MMTAFATTGAAIVVALMKRERRQRRVQVDIVRGIVENRRRARRCRRQSGAF
jgi:hypothetical protein